MSSIPGLTLESYVMWNHDFIVIGHPSANASLQIAEALGINTRRVNLSQAQFNTVLTIYEPYRTIVETRLEDFDEENQSWRDYAGCCFNDILDSTEMEVSQTLETLFHREKVKLQENHV